MTISKLASDVAENHWETKGMKHALQAERDYNLMTTQKLERLKVRNGYSQSGGENVNLPQPVKRRVRTGPKNLERPGILLWHFQVLESPGKRFLVL